MEKTLIGKNGYLFLKNDDAREFDVSCNNICLVKYPLDRYNKYLDKYYITVFPNKSILCKQYLPDNYDAKYRPGLLKYKEYFKDRLFDSYNILKDFNESYYKTDTHMNLNGSYQVYINFVRNINNLYNLNIPIKILKIECMQNINLNELNLSIGDLTWDINKGTQVLESTLDNHYFSNDLIQVYCQKNDNNITFFDYSLVDKTNDINDQVINWPIISNHILYKLNKESIKKKVVIFYDSFLLSTIWLYLTMFEEVYMIKNIYDETLVDKINPDLLFEFRVERFLF
jgi:hypothetical protein